VRDDAASTGLGLTLGGFAVFLGTLVLTAVTPEGPRTWVFLGGIATVGALCLVGGIRGRRALTEPGAPRARAAVSAVLGLVVGVTAGIFVFWNLVALAS
jgi:hypothetical protein